MRVPDDVHFSVPSHRNGHGNRAELHLLSLCLVGLSCRKEQTAASVLPFHLMTVQVHTHSGNADLVSLQVIKLAELLHHTLNGSHTLLPTAHSLPPGKGSKLTLLLLSFSLTLSFPHTHTHTHSKVSQSTLILHLCRTLLHASQFYSVFQGFCCSNLRDSSVFLFFQVWTSRPVNSHVFFQLVFLCLAASTAGILSFLHILVCLLPPTSPGVGCIAPATEGVYTYISQKPQFSSCSHHSSFVLQQLQPHLSM